MPVVDSSVMDVVETAKSMPLLSPLIKDRSTEPRDLSLLLFLSDEKKQEFISKKYKNNSPLQQKQTAVFFFWVGPVAKARCMLTKFIVG